MENPPDNSPLHQATETDRARVRRHQWILRLVTLLLASIPLILVFVFGIGTGK